MVTKGITAAAAALLVAACVHAQSLVADGVAGSPGWPEFHGPGRTNISPDQGLLKEWPEGGPPLLWRYWQCGKGYSSVVLRPGRFALLYPQDVHRPARALAGSQKVRKLVLKARCGG